MNKIFISLILASFSIINSSAQTPRINLEKDLLLVQYDCKTDVDDLHSGAAFRTIIANDNYAVLNFYAVAGAYGIQEGLYVAPNDLFELAFGEQWSDAHTNFEKAVKEVVAKVKTTLQKGGDIWIAEAGQSDFTAAVVKTIHIEVPGVNTRERFHVVQHSTWNEEVTEPDKLALVKANTDYNKIADGNATGNGTPGFREPNAKGWKAHITNAELINIWHQANRLAIQYNGKDGRYVNEAMKACGLDFSDTAEVCWILGLETLEDTEEFFTYFGQ